MSNPLLTNLSLKTKSGVRAVKVFSLSGALLWAERETSFSLENFSPRIYIVEVESMNSIQYLK